MYDSIRDLPFVCQFNLPEAAQKVYRTAFNRAWREAGESKERFFVAQKAAWAEVRNRFERDQETGVWMAKTATLAPHPDPLPANEERVAQSAG